MNPSTTEPQPQLPGESQQEEAMQEPDRESMPLVVQLGTTSRGTAAWSPTDAVPHVLVRGRMARQPDFTLGSGGHAPEFTLGREGRTQELNREQVASFTRDVIAERLDALLSATSGERLAPIVLAVRWHPLMAADAALIEVLESVARLGRMVGVHLVLGASVDDPTVPQGIAGNSRRVAVDDVLLEVASGSDPAEAVDGASIGYESRGA